MELPGHDSDGIRIVLLDDSAPLRALLTELLQDLGIVDQIVQVEDVSATLVAFDCGVFDIAILDLNIPGDGEIRNGIDLVREIKSRYPTTKVAILTALANPLDRNACLEAGADRFYDKGEVESLLDWVKESASRG